jgi:uncharacterized protein (TIRG00374 family)
LSPITKRLLPLFLGLLLLAGILLFVDLRQTLDVLRNADILWFSVGFLATIVSRALMAYKWNLLLRTSGASVQYLEALRIYYVSGFLGLFLPATVGMDVVRAFLVKRDDSAYSPIIASIIVERLLGFFMLVLAALLASPALILFLADSNHSLKNLPLFAITLALICGLFAGASLTRGFRSFVTRAARYFAESSWAGRASRRFERLFEAYWAYREHKVVLGTFCVLTAAEIALVVFWNYCVGRSLAIDLDFVAYVIVVPVTVLLIRLPISIAGIGVHEGAFLLLLVFIGVPRDEALAFGLLGHALAILALVPGGLIYAFVPAYRRRRAEASTGAALVRPSLGRS